MDLRRSGGAGVRAAAGTVAGLALALSGCASAAGAAPAHRGGPAASTAGIACSASRTPPAGLAVLTVSQLPSQAIETLRLVAAGGPYPYTEDDTVYGNYSGALPRERYGYYHEFTVVTPGSATRGARRVVTGSAGEDYYTPDHYVTFDWIACSN
ncbi:MAG TPA: ribonuclease domain-containing protein [Actinocrinis sp.]|nr:ribonuclease domain-containing protein [Actinocrinis sp.]